MSFLQKTLKSRKQVSGYLPFSMPTSIQQLVFLVYFPISTDIKGNMLSKLIQIL